LQTLLKVQLQQPGDVSAVVETDDGFLLFLARSRSEHVLRVAALGVAKQNYETWLSRQTPSPTTQAAAK
jgi:hypothetical protein